MNFNTVMCGCSSQVGSCN